ncbi:hypothetical protein A0J61_08441 [Choanephora cucurbitarum]|uniref:DUF676 domain-containing protein n=1 Tax=Choanephora cucurbitarum TaxID=101091 RepID=A0A1C7N341_9FUNG|nr:hypothetical protein A0J61_08441 [Choanephora cucurbitarum]
MSYIERQIKEKYKNKVYVLNSDVNKAKYTYDGVDICGKRLAKDIEATVAQLEKKGKIVKKISIIGYSLGGLIVRFAIGVLGQKGFFDTIEPDYFITFATPHIGVKVPSPSTFYRIFNFISGRLVSRSGEQLQLIDVFDEKTGKPVLEVMSDPDQVYFRTLSKFKTRRIYANIANDATVPYWTAGIEVRDYFQNHKGKLDILVDDDYISLVNSFDIRGPNYKKRENRQKMSTKYHIIRYALFCLSPILVPLWLTFVISFVGTQGLISRYRVSQLLREKHDSERDPLQRKPSFSDRYIDGNILAGALDAVNLPGEERDEPGIASEEGTPVPDKDRIRKFDYHLEPGKLLLKQSKPLAFDKTTKHMYDNLNQLEWERVWVYIRLFNAHGGIICRQKVYEVDGGKATIQHFLDTTHLSL